MLRALVAGLALWALAALAVAASALWHARPPERALRADAILVLGGGLDPGGRPSASTRRRAEAAAALWQAGAAPLVLFSGGATGGPGASEAGVMAGIAAAAGVPESAILREDRATSTLQNALLARPILAAAGAGDVIVVTDGFHMARGIASCRWAGIGVAGGLAASVFGERAVRGAGLVLREALAWGFNLARVAGYHALGLAGVARERRIRLLADLPAGPPTGRGAGRSGAAEDGREAG